MLNRKLSIVLVVVIALITIGPAQADAWWIFGDNDQEAERLILATTTSTENSGLLAELIPPFEKETNYRVDVVAVGTGKALQHGRDGDADVLLVHAKEAELEFINNDYGTNREEIMYNDFVILGPADDPANVEDTTSAVAAFRAIANTESVFISRGDNSGTHKKELSIWEKVGISPEGSWYQETGQGMGQSLTIANQKEAYILSDRGTYLAVKDKINLEILSEGDPIFYNLYGVIAVNQDLHPDVNYQGAQALIKYLTSQQAQEIIKDYKVEEERLFNPLQL